MLSLRVHVIICASVFAAILLFAVGGNVLQAAGVPPPPTNWRWAIMAFFLALVIAFALSFVPVMVKLALSGADAKAQAVIVWIIWGLMAAGTVVALPAMIADGFFQASDAPAAASR